VRWERASSFGFSALVFVCQQKPNVLDRAKWFSTMTPNGFGLDEGGDFHHKR